LTLIAALRTKAFIFPMKPTEI